MGEEGEVGGPFEGKTDMIASMQLEENEKIKCNICGRLLEDQLVLLDLSEPSDGSEPIVARIFCLDCCPPKEE